MNERRSECEVYCRLTDPRRGFIYANLSLCLIDERTSEWPSTALPDELLSSRPALRTSATDRTSVGRFGSKRVRAAMREV